METEEFLEKVKVLDLKETDILVFTAEEEIPRSVHHLIRRSVERMGIKNKIIILERGMDIKILRDEDNK